MPPSKEHSALEVISGLCGRTDVACVLIASEDTLGYGLHPDEEKSLSPAAVAKRREEFTAGRAAANRAMRELGIAAPPPVPQGKMREPLWPEGVVGSITHSHPWTIAVAARSSSVAAIGIDLESSARMKEEDISRHICIDSEIAWMRGHPQPLRALTMIFSSKEAVFKALSPRCKRYFDFKDARLVWLPGEDAFRGELLIHLDKKYTRGYSFEVSCRSSKEWIFSYLIEESG